MTPEEERAAVVRYIREALGQGYPWPRGKHEPCEHGCFKWQDCIACYDDFLDRKLEEVLAGAHLSYGEPG